MKTANILACAQRASPLICYVYFNVVNLVEYCFGGSEL